MWAIIENPVTNRDRSILEGIIEGSTTILKCRRHVLWASKTAAV